MKFFHLICKPILRFARNRSYANKFRFLFHFRDRCVVSHSNGSGFLFWLCCGGFQTGSMLLDKIAGRRFCPTNFKLLSIVDNHQLITKWDRSITIFCDKSFFHYTFEFIWGFDGEEDLWTSCSEISRKSCFWFSGGQGSQ